MSGLKLNSYFCWERESDRPRTSENQASSDVVKYISYVIPWRHYFEPITPSRFLIRGIPSYSVTDRLNAWVQNIQSFVSVWFAVDSIFDPEIRESLIGDIVQRGKLLLRTFLDRENLLMLCYGIWRLSGYRRLKLASFHLCTNELSWKYRSTVRWNKLYQSNDIVCSSNCLYLACVILEYLSSVYDATAGAIGTPIDETIKPHLVFGMYMVSLHISVPLSVL